MKKQLTGILAVGAIVVIVIGGTLFWLSSSDSVDTSSEVVADPIGAIYSLRENGAFEEAYDIAVTALQADMENTALALEAGRLAMILRQRDKAHEHMQLAWDLGEKKLPVMLIMVETLPGTPLDKIAAFDRLFLELESSATNLDAKARFYSQVGRNEEALEIWKSLCAAAPEEDLIVRVARKLEMIGRREEAVAFLETQQAGGHLAAEGTNLLASLLVFDNKFEEADALMKAAEVDDPHREWALKRAVFSLVQGRLPEAEKALGLLARAPDDHPLSLVVAHEARITLSILRVILEGPEADLDALAGFANLEMQLIPPRMVTTPLLGLQANPKELEGERLLYAFLKSLQAGETPSQAQFSRLESFLGGSPAITWLGIRNAMTTGRAGDAVALYAEIEELHPLESVEGVAGFFFKSPLFLTEVARAFYQNGRPREALTLINHLHERELHSPTSIRLFAQIMQETGRSSDPDAMQAALARQFTEDLDIQLSTVGQAVDRGEGEKAMELIAPLVAANPENEELKMLKFMLLLNQGKAEAVLEQLESSGLPPRNQALVRARVAMQAEDEATAEWHFKEAIDAADFYGYLDYARYLVERGRTEEANNLYDEILDTQPDNVIALQGKAIIDELNGNVHEAIWGLRKVLRLLPEDPYTLTRLAKLHLQDNNPRDALMTVNRVLSRSPGNTDATNLQVTAMIQLALQQSVEALQQRKLIEVEQRLDELLLEVPENPQLFLFVHLAAAYRDAGQPNRAGQIYGELLSLDAEAWRTTSLRREDILTAMEALNE
jgi:tetratricopeptide (TPR) repeat protein